MSDASTEYFQRLARVYDSATAAEGAWTPPRVLAQYAATHLDADAAVLDIGIGTGQALMELQKLLPHIQGSGVDPSAAMLDASREKLPGAHLVLGDIDTALAQRMGPFDGVIASGVTEFVADLSAWIAKAKRLLRQNGTIAFTFEPQIGGHPVQEADKSLVVPDPKSSLYVADFFTYRRSNESVRTILIRNGFTVAAEHEFVAYRKLDADIFYRLVVAKLTA